MLPKQSPNDIRQRTDLVVERVLQWSRYEVASGNSVHIFFSMDNLWRNGVRATIREDDVTVRISLCEGILPEASSECAALGGERIPSTHHPQPHWNSICCSRVSNRASWNRCRPRSIPLMLVNWLGAKTHLGYAEGHLISPQHGRKLSCATAAGMCGLRSQ